MRAGRDGHGRSSDRILDLDIRPPTELGGPDGATNPEQLFAPGYAACFQSAMSVVGRRMMTVTSASEVTGRVTLGTIEGGAFGIAVELDMRSPDVDDETVRKVVDAAHEVCPCSNTTRATSR